MKKFDRFMEVFSGYFLGSMIVLSGIVAIPVSIFVVLGSIAKIMS